MFGVGAFPLQIFPDGLLQVGGEPTSCASVSTGGRFSSTFNASSCSRERPRAPESFISVFPLHRSSFVLPEQISDRVAQGIPLVLESW